MNDLIKMAFLVLVVIGILVSAGLLIQIVALVLHVLTKAKP